MEDERLAAPQLVIEDSRKARIPAFCHSSSNLGCLLVFRVKINIKVLSLHHPELETLILNLVPSEILGVQGRDREN
jgi:hypothetical protein